MSNKRDKDKLWESYIQINEGAFSGPGGNPDQEGWGVETSDDVAESDIHGRLDDISNQIVAVNRTMDTLDTWIANTAPDVLETDEEVYDDLNSLKQSINGFVERFEQFAAKYEVQ